LATIGRHVGASDWPIGDDVIEREWVLVAEHGDGPEIPTLAAVLLAEALLAGTVPVGGPRCRPIARP